jgi:hypothetical protein
MTPENKKRVIDQTMSAGEFGAPWIVGVNKESERMDWVRNNKWDQAFAHLAVPYTPVEIVLPKESKLRVLNGRILWAR